MRLALIQIKQNELYQFQKSGIRYTPEEVRRYQADMVCRNRVLMQKAAGEGVDLIVTTEAVNFPGSPGKVEAEYMQFVPGMDDGIFTDFSEIAKSGHCYVAAGCFRKERCRGSLRLYNSVCFFDRDGRLDVVYDKIHLAGDENEYLTEGREYKVVDTDFGKVGMAVCWDMQFPETCQHLSDMGADLIVAPTWGWEWIYGPCRAYENGVYVASAMAVPYEMPIQGLRSPSEAITPDGRILTRGSYTEEGIVLCEIRDICDCAELRKMRREGRRNIDV
ncbi:MAG TPA: hypothetical protein DCZ91_12970 [Lachnospiraceae bacterium]|nr:hypothetical protein [Lachnospiraceae bacterium]